MKWRSAEKDLADFLIEYLRDPAHAVESESNKGIVVGPGCAMTMIVCLQVAPSSLLIEFLFAQA